jgi:hypothetical protein
MSSRAGPRRIGLVLCAWLLVACSGFGMPGTITLGPDELQAQLAQRFPIQRKLLDAFELKLSEPQLRLDAQARRLSTELTLQLDDLRADRGLLGRLALGYALRYEPADATVRLVQPRVERVELADRQGIPARRADAVQPVIIALAERLLDDLVLYRVPAARLDMLRAIGLRPGSLSVTPAGVELSLEPLPPVTVASAPSAPR